MTDIFLDVGGSQSEVILSPQGTFDKVWGHLLIRPGEGDCHEHLVDRDQGGC